jgi:hypothetical protein
VEEPISFFPIFLFTWTNIFVIQFLILVNK